MKSNCKRSGLRVLIPILFVSGAQALLAIPARPLAVVPAVLRQDASGAEAPEQVDSIIRSMVTGDRGAYNSALTELNASHRDDVLSGISRALDGALKNERTRALLYELLAHLGQEGISPTRIQNPMHHELLLSGRRDSSPSVRAHVAVGLGRLSEVHMEQGLQALAGLLDDEHSLVVSAAAKAVVAVGAEHALVLYAQLEKALQGREEEVSRISEELEGVAPREREVRLRHRTEFSATASRDVIRAQIALVGLEEVLKRRKRMSAYAQERLAEAMAKYLFDTRHAFLRKEPGAAARDGAILVALDDVLGVLRAGAESADSTGVRRAGQVRALGLLCERTDLKTTDQLRVQGHLVALAYSKKYPDTAHASASTIEALKKAGRWIGE